MNLLKVLSITSLLISITLIYFIYEGFEANKSLTSLNNSLVEEVAALNNSITEINSSIATLKSSNASSLLEIKDTLGADVISINNSLQKLEDYVEVLDDDLEFLDDTFWDLYNHVRPTATFYKPEEIWEIVEGNGGLLYKMMLNEIYDSKDGDLVMGFTLFNSYNSENEELSLSFTIYDNNDDIILEKNQYIPDNDFVIEAGEAKDFYLILPGMKQSEFGSISVDMISFDYTTSLK